MMSKITMIVDDDAIHWEEHTSEQGGKYKVGFLKDDIPHAASQLAAEVALKPLRFPFNIEVHWRVNSSETFDTDFQLTTGLFSYYLRQYNVSNFYKYNLTFENLQHFNYHFTDETGDRYSVKTYVNRTHYLQYNSKKPTIVRVEGK